MWHAIALFTVLLVACRGHLMNENRQSRILEASTGVYNSKDTPSKTTSYKYNKQIVEATPKGLVLYVHGYGGSKDSLVGNAIMDYVVTKGFDYFSFDGYGFGSSTEDLAKVTLSMRVSQLQEIFEEYVLKQTAYIKVILVGHSMGGLVSSIAMRDTKSLRYRMVATVLMAPGVIFSKGDLDVVKINGLSQQMQDDLSAGKSIDYGGFILTQAILDDARDISLPENTKVGGDFPVILLWGTKDTDTPNSFAPNIQKWVDPETRVTMVDFNDGGHLFDRAEDKSQVNTEFDKVFVLASTFKSNLMNTSSYSGLVSIIVLANLMNFIC